MGFTIKSKRLGKDITFSIPGRAYIFINIGWDGGYKGEGSLGNQICHGGSFSGGTMSYSGTNQKQFEHICRKWWRAFLRKQA